MLGLAHPTTHHSAFSSCMSLSAWLRSPLHARTAHDPSVRPTSVPSCICKAPFRISFLFRALDVELRRTPAERWVRLRRRDSLRVRFTSTGIAVRVRRQAGSRGRSRGAESGQASLLLPVNTNTPHKRGRRGDVLGRVSADRARQRDFPSSTYTAYSRHIIQDPYQNKQSVRLAQGTALKIAVT